MLKCYCQNNLSLKYIIKKDKLHVYGRCEHCKLTIKLNSKKVLNELYKKAYKHG